MTRPMVNSVSNLSSQSQKNNRSLSNAHQKTEFPFSQNTNSKKNPTVLLTKGVTGKKTPGMLKDQNRFLCFLGAHLEQTCHCFSSGWAVKLETDIQQRAGDLLHHSSLLHPNCQVPLERVELKVALKRSNVKAARKSWLVF